jgi:TonB family protein
LALRRNRRGLWPWLAASFAAHGIALCALLVAASHSPMHLRAATGHPDGVMLVSLLDVSTPASRAVLPPRSPTTGNDAIKRQPVEVPPPSLERAPRRPEPRPTLLRTRRPSRARPLPSTPDPTPRDEPTPTRAEPPVEIAEAGPPPPQADAQPESTGHSPALQLAASSPSRQPVRAGLPGSTRAGGSPSGYETGRLDRLARPAAPIEPHYPPRARQRGDEGDVIVDAWVGSEGETDRVAVAQSAGAELDEAALAVVRSARFHPALRDGRRVPSRVALRLHFQLE